MMFSAPRILSGATLLAVAQSQITCKNGAHVIVARASNEPAGYGILKPVADNITSMIPNSDSIPVPYPATIFGPLYTDSEPEGVGNLTNLIKEYGDACPNSKMALLGYSQGAQVIGDALIGADYPDFQQAFKMTQGIDQKYIDQIFAVIMMGDPANVNGQPFHVGNSTMSGNFPRANTAKWVSTGLVQKIRSYCDANDLFCAHGKSLNVHIGYIPEYGPNAVKFVVDKWNALGGSSGNSTGSATSTGAYGGGAATSTGGYGGGAATASSPGAASPTVAVGAAPEMGPSVAHAVIIAVVAGLVARLSL